MIALIFPWPALALSTGNKLGRFGVMPHKQVRGRETPESQNMFTTGALVL